MSKFMTVIVKVYALTILVDLALTLPKRTFIFNLLQCSFWSSDCVEKTQTKANFIWLAFGILNLVISIFMKLKFIQCLTDLNLYSKFMFASKYRKVNHIFSELKEILIAMIPLDHAVSTLTKN